MIETITDYEIIRTLGRNSRSGRVTYLAQKNDRQVVIKQFQFAKGADWSDMKELEREISILKGLQHQQIPRYIESFETETGFCLVQEYIAAPSLAEVRSCSLEQIQEIGRQLLDILVYLQGLHPPVLHRDIKPENILYNGQGKVFLVDFGFSRLGSVEIAASSIMVGTIGFIPPELFSGCEPSKASDLYSVGATLLSLITGTPSANMERLLDDEFRFCDAAYNVDRPFSNWLKKMTAVRVNDRFADAVSALKELNKPLIKMDSLSYYVETELQKPRDETGYLGADIYDRPISSKEISRYLEGCRVREEIFSDICKRFNDKKISWLYYSSLAIAVLSISAVVMTVFTKLDLIINTPKFEKKTVKTEVSYHKVENVEKLVFEVVMIIPLSGFLMLCYKPRN